MGFNYKGQIQDSIPDCNFYHWETFNKNNKNKRRSLKMLWSSVEAVVFIVQFSMTPFTCLWWECSQMRTCFKVLFALCPVTLGDLLPVSPGSYSDRRLNQTQRYDDVAKSLWWWNVTDYKEKRRLVTVFWRLHSAHCDFLLSAATMIPPTRISFQQTKWCCVHSCRWWRMMVQLRVKSLSGGSPSSLLPAAL